MSQHLRFSELNLVWVDMEMSGLNPDSDRVLEVAVVVTGPELDVIEEGPVLVLRQAADVLDGMDRWNTATHARSGLIDKVRSSSLDEEPASDVLIEFLQSLVPSRQVADVRQLHLPGSTLHGALDAAARSVLSLSQRRCQHA